MRIIRHALAAAALVLAAVPATAQLPYSGLYVFGDSLVDSGNARFGSLLFGLPDPAPPEAGYFNGRFSNGPTFADYLSEAITGSYTAPSFLGGDNYGFGGALTAVYPGETRLSFPTQLNNFGARTIAADALVLVTFGGNDVRATVETPGDQAFPDAIADLRSGIERLIGAGARNIIVTGLPDIGTLPELDLEDVPDAQQALLSDRSEFLNDRFEEVALDLRQETGLANLRFFDLFGFQEDVLADPTIAGLPADLDTTTPCLLAGGTAVEDGCGGFLFFDPIHPTRQVHAAIADRLIALAAVPEPSSWLLLIVGFGGIGIALRRREPIPLAA